MKKYIIQYQNSITKKWYFTGREFDISDNHPLYLKEAWNSLEQARQEYHADKWRLVYVEIIVVDGEL